MEKVILWVTAGVSIPCFLSYVMAMYDALRQYLYTISGKRSLKHDSRLALRSLFAFLCGLTALPHLLSAFLLGCIAFMSFHLLFDPIKNMYSGQPWYYMGTTANYDRFSRTLWKRYPGAVTLILEGVLWLFTSFVYLFII